MNWYYVANGQQVGPLTEADFQAALATGKVTPATLVWHEGLANWQPYSELAGAAAAAGMARCSECGREFPGDAVLSIGNARVCAACKPVYLQKVREGAVPQSELRYAGFWIRVGAKIIDGIIVGLPMLVVVLPVMFMAESRLSPMAGLGLQLGLQLLGLIISGVYTTFFLGKYGATPGKMLLKLKVITPEGGPISYPRALGRYFAEILSYMICYIGYLMVAFDKEEHQALHDRICNTRVIRR